jgi:DNA-binding NarL/FixJ family response regulator
MATIRETARVNRTLGTGPGPASALVFSRSRLVRTGIRNTLDRAGFTVALEAPSPAMVMSAARRLVIGLAVLEVDSDFGQDFPPEAFRTLTAATRVVLLCDCPAASVAALAAGAAACLSRSASPQELILAAVSAARGRRLIGGSAVLEMIKLAEAGRVNREAMALVQTRLSPRETQVLQALANGWGNGVIAASLHISPKTVKNHVGNILHKLGLENRIQAAVLAVQAGIGSGEIISNFDAVRAAMAGPASAGRPQL